jgi:nucleoid DNA-binding protein
MPRVITRRDLIQALADKVAVPYADVHRIVYGVFDQILEALARGDKVELRRFGVFEVVERGPRLARNPRKNYAVRIPARKVVRFRPGKDMEERITKASQQGPIVPEQAPNTGEPPRVSGEGPA